MLHSLVDHALHIIFASHVHLKGQGQIAKSSDLISDLFCCVQVNISYCHATPFLCQTECNGTANTPSSPGDDGYLILKVVSWHYQIS